ncbi:MAG: phage minor head protein [Dysosmobacter welbionis]
MEYFRRRIPVTAKVFYSIAYDYRVLAFTVSGYSSCRSSAGSTRSCWRLWSRETPWRSSLQHERLPGAGGLRGRHPYQAENIFRTNIQTAYNVGHYKQMTDPEVMKLRPYWQYDAVNDSRTRPSHLAMDGRVFPADSPVWDTWFPPNGFKCRCTVRSLSRRQVERLGLRVETRAPSASMLKDGRFVNIMPDPQFASNPAKTPWRPDLKGIRALAKAFREREKSGPGEKA